MIKLPGLEIPLGQGVHKIPVVKVLAFEDGYDCRASAERFARWCYDNVRGGWMDNFHRAYRQQGGRE